MKDWGYIEPVRNRWVWPFSQMEEGDFFRVDWADKHPSQLRHYVSVRAAQLGKYFSVKKDDPDCPGYTKVTCVAPPEERQAKSVGEASFEGEMGLVKMREWYGFDLGADMPWAQLDPAQPEEKARASVAVVQLAKPPVDLIVWSSPLPQFDIGIVLGEDRLDFERLPKHTTPQMWRRLIAERVEAIMG